MLKAYYRLAKPGIVYGNLITAAAGFFLASKGHIDISILIFMLVGIGLVMASACVFNNYIDRDIDKLMSRTADRGLVSGQISPRNSLIYASCLGLLGAASLAYGTNLLTLYIACLGFFVYVVMYGYFKRQSVHGTEVGSVAGAVPPVVGYCAVSGRFDGAALLLFLILVCWQMPHFYAIALRRLKDYQAAHIPVLPAVKGQRVTQMYILAYTVAFMIVASLLTVFGYTGLTYLLGMLVLGAYWAWLAWKSLQAPRQKALVGKLFGFSLIVLLGFSLLISVDVWLP